MIFLKEEVQIDNITNMLSIIVEFLLIEIVYLFISKKYKNGEIMEDNFDNYLFIFIFVLIFVLIGIILYSFLKIC